MDMAPNTTINIESYTFQGATGVALRSTAKRYTTSAPAANEGLTLIFAHCLGSHKEQWEPTIELVFRLQQQKNKQQRIREAWAFDWQSHGEGAVVNGEFLDSRTSAVSVIEWASALELFIRNRLQGHKIVLIGHSAGTGAILTSMKHFPTRESSFVAVFLVEPMLICQELFNIHSTERQDAARRFMELTLQRRDSWPDRDAAATYLRRRLPWKSWDPRVFERYIRYGLRAVESSRGQTVSIKTSKHQEGLAYIHFEPYIDATVVYRERCNAIPFHLIFGAELDFVPRYMQDALCDAPKGYHPASVVRIPNAGHLVVQEQPDRLAAAICDQLNNRKVQFSSRL